MKSQIIITALLLGTVPGLWAQGSIAPPACFASDLSIGCIDDFMTGSYDKSLRAGSDTNFQVGDPFSHMVGGARRTYFAVPQNPFNQAGELAFSNGTMTVSTGPKLFYRVETTYGVDPNTGANKPLHLNLSKYDRFRVNFDTNDLVLNFNIVVLFNNGSSWASQGFNVNPNPSGKSFYQDFMFTDFSTVAPSINWSDIAYITLVFQSGSAVGANDFAIKSVTVRYGL